MATYTKEFRSIGEFRKYINDTPFNLSFAKRVKKSSQVDPSRTKWTKTPNYEAAESLLVNGWDEMATKLNGAIKAKQVYANMATKRRNVPGVVGFAPIVPLYIAGVPQNMLQQIRVKCKSKIVSIDKSISYSCSVSSDKIIEESVKALQVVQQLEASGYRVNLSIVWCISAGGDTVALKVRIKDAKDKLNISKVAFPLVHPSMLRRICFKFLEVFPNVNSKFCFGYGYPMSASAIGKIFPDDIVIPEVWNVDPSQIKDISDVTARV